MRTRNSSPTFSCFAGFARVPFTWTLPPATASAESARVLKKRAAQSQRSRRTAVGSALRAEIVHRQVRQRSHPDRERRLIDIKSWRVIRRRFGRVGPRRRNAEEEEH